MANMMATPVGKLTGFVAIEKPSTKFDDNGVYSCQVEFTGKDAKKMKDVIDGIMAESLATSKNVKRAANPPYTIEGKTLVVKFKQKARITTRGGDVYEKNINIFDAANKPVDEFLGIGAGSTVRVAYTPYKWAVAALGAGCTLQLTMVQVIDLVKRSTGSAGGNVFDAVDGFTAAKKDSNPFENSEEVKEATDEVDFDDDSDDGDF